MKLQTISIIGLGYIGLPTAAVLSTVDNIHVVGVDVNQSVVDKINSGQVHIVEPGLDSVIESAVSKGFFRATVLPEEADVFIIAVPTPFTENKKPDLSYVLSAVQSIALVLKPGNLIILESTSPVGTTERLSEFLASERPDLTMPHTFGDNSDIRIAYCPERVLPGNILAELVRNDRVIGGLSKASSKAAVEFYELFVTGSTVITDSRTAELAKLTENSFRDVNIAFANELSIICENLSINVWDLISLCNRHPRVDILKPGPGVGGHCIAVDPWFIVSEDPLNAKLIRLAREINDYKTDWVIEKINNEVLNLNLESGAQPVIACLGLAFKPDIDDLRESPAKKVIQKLMEIYEDLMIVEPNVAKKDILEALGSAKVRPCSLSDALGRADIVCILVAHKEFINLRLDNSLVLDFSGVSKS